MAKVKTQEIKNAISKKEEQNRKRVKMEMNILTILSSHTTRDNPITAMKIEEQLGIPYVPEATHFKVRKLLNQTRIDFNLPLVSTSKGYFLAETEDEIDLYNARLDKRITKINERKIDRKLALFNK